MEAIFDEIIKIDLVNSNLILVSEVLTHYLLQKRPEILARNPQAKVTEVVKEIARCWGLMTKEDRSKYKEQAKRGNFISRIFPCVTGINAK